VKWSYSMAYMALAQNISWQSFAVSAFATCLPVHEIRVVLLVIVPHELATLST
jgi:hypothetical protein